MKKESTKQNDSALVSCNSGNKELQDNFKSVNIENIINDQLAILDKRRKSSDRVKNGSLFL